MSVKMTSLVWNIQNLPPSEKLVALALADNSNDDGECWPGLERVKIKTGYKSTRGLQYVIRKLIKKNIVNYEDRHRKDGRQTTNLYKFNIQEIEKLIRQIDGGTLNGSSPPPPNYSSPSP